CRSCRWPPKCGKGLTMNNIRKADEAVVLTGRDKKRRGTVVARVDADKVLVESANVVEKPVKANPKANNPARSDEKTLTIHISHVALFNPATGKGDRVGVREVDGRKVRVFRSNGAVVGAKA